MLFHQRILHHFYKSSLTERPLVVSTLQSVNNEQSFLNPGQIPLPWDPDFSIEATGAAKTLVNNDSGPQPVKLYAGWFCSLDSPQYSLCRSELKLSLVQRVYTVFEEKKASHVSISKWAHIKGLKASWSTIREACFWHNFFGGQIRRSCGMSICK